MSSGKSTTTYRPIPDFPGYLVCDEGSAWSCLNSKGMQVPRWRKIGTHNSDGYPIVYIFNGKGKRRFLLSRLILEVFVGPCPSGMQACHFPDRNPKNCRLDNLRWDTVKANMDDREIHGNTAKGTEKHNAKITEDDVMEIARLRSDGMAIRDIAPRYGLHPATISRILGRVRWKHVGLPDGLTKRNTRRTPEDVCKIRRLYSEGMTQKQIRDLMGIDSAVISRIVNRKVFSDIC